MIIKPKSLFRKKRTCRYRAKYYYASFVDSALQRARENNIPCDIDMAWARETYTGHCALTGLPFEEFRTIPKRANPLGPSIDRINSGLGYLKENCRWIMLCLNSFKGISTDDMMYKVAKALLVYRANLYSKADLVSA